MPYVSSKGQSCDKVRVISNLWRVSFQSGNTPEIDLVGKKFLVEMCQAQVQLVFFFLFQLAVRTPPPQTTLANSLHRALCHKAWTR